MKYENIKSIILTFLVALSLLLYYLLWTDQGENIEAISGSTMEQERIGQVKEVSQL
ncbi:MAG TPA: two-component system activity regulator YycH, partial [Niallia sp.]|nr:two-component system activity regulator YycH [Niallia sp.]